MEICFPHTVTFTNKDNISVSDVAQSLLANERML